MVFSDLKVEGYAMADRFERLDMEHALSTLSKLSKLHAAGVCYTERVCFRALYSDLVFIDVIFTGGISP